MNDATIGLEGSEDVIIRGAEHADISGIVRMLADDPLGAGREQYSDPLPDAYLDAFNKLQGQSGNDILVA